MAPHIRLAAGPGLVSLRPVNMTGLPSLPTETLFEIVSHLQAVPVPCPNTTDYVLSCAYVALRTLRALSETCQRLRSVFLALSYQRIEACASVRVPETYELYGKKYGPGSPVRDFPWRMATIAQELTTELLRQVEVVTVRHPSLAQYVRSVAQQLLLIPNQN